MESLDAEPKCLVRATAGNTKISTMVCVILLYQYLQSQFQVSGKDVVRFQMAYSNILKSQMDNLKRKEKKKKKKSTKVDV
jgi:signal recognition particle subunit SRP14